MAVGQRQRWHFFPDGAVYAPVDDEGNILVNYELPFQDIDKCLRPTMFVLLSEKDVYIAMSSKKASLLDILKRGGSRYLTIADRQRTLDNTVKVVREWGVSVRDTETEIEVDYVILMQVLVD